jgi:predicted enzyme related to lactoylglutathione lyase
MTKHAIDWFEIPTADFQRGIAFYEAIFQFKLNSMVLGNGLKMAMFPVANPAEAVGGALTHHPDFYKPSQDGTLVYLNADPDLAAVLGRVEKAGGRIQVPKTQISPEHGFMAVFTDSEGNRMALHSRA